MIQRKKMMPASQQLKSVCPKGKYMNVDANGKRNFFSVKKKSETPTEK